MTKFEFQSDVMPRLADLAEAYDRKPPSDAALRIWRETLESLQVRPVTLALQSWSRSKTKFPAPAEIYSAANDLDAEAREKRAEDEKATHAVELRRMGATPRGRAALKMIRDLIARKVAEPQDPKAWARRLLDRYADGDTTVADIALRMACDALHVDVEALKASRASAPAAARRSDEVPA